MDCLAQYGLHSLLLYDGVGAIGLVFQDLFHGMESLSDVHHGVLLVNQTVNTMWY